MSMSFRWLAALGAALAATALNPADACDDNDEDGLDVALVLSGGGAFTTTQVGALSVIQELGVPIHCVVGASMGAVTGALYAAGYDAHDLREVYSTPGWGETFRGGVDRLNKPYLQKESEDQYFSGYVAGVGPDGLRLPGGFGDMSGLQSRFRDLLRHIPLSLDFNALRVPYRSVAMDLSTGDAVAFEEGDLVQTMLASMAVPGLFAPRQIEGRLFVDGGLAAQLPVKTALDMGADLIIALDTTTDPPPVEPGVSVAGATQQLIRITVYRNWLEQTALLDADDALIRPDLSGLTTASFDRAEEGFASGRAAAERARSQLIDIRDKAAPARDRPIDRLKPQEPDGPLILINESGIDDDVIRDRFNYDTLDLDDRTDLSRRLQDLAAFGAFGDVDFVANPDVAILKVSERPLGRNLLQAGLRASTTFNGDSNFAVLGRFSRRPFSRRGGEFSVSVELGTDFGVTAQLYQPLGGGGRFFVQPAITFRGEELLFDIGDTRVGEFLQQQGDVRLRLGRELGRWGIVALDGVVALGRFDPQVTIAPDVFLPFTYEQGGVGGFFAVDTLNRAAWPTAGHQLRVSAQTLFDIGEDADTDRYGLAGQSAFQLGGLGVNLRAEAERIDNDADNPIDILDLGGFRRLSAFSQNSIPNNEYVLGVVEVFRRLTATDQLVDFPVYIGGTFEFAHAEFDLFEQGVDEDFFNGSVYLGGQTILGPALLGAGFGQGGEFALFLHFGRSF